MDDPKNKHMKDCLEWILMVSLIPIAFLFIMLTALYSLLRFLSKVALLFIIIAINTPFLVMYNLSISVFQYSLARGLQKFIPARFQKSSWSWSDPRHSVGIQIKLIVSDFFKTVAAELLLVMSTGIITYFTAPLSVFYYSTSIWVVAIFHKWMNTSGMKTALSCLCDGYGLSPMMFLFSFIGFFDIGCHPVAKCSFVASKAFLFVRDDPSQFNKEANQDLVYGKNPNMQVFHVEGLKYRYIEEGHSKLNEKDGQKLVLEPTNRIFKWERDEIKVDVEEGDKEINNVVPVREPFPNLCVPSSQVSVGLANLVVEGVVPVGLANFDVEEGDNEFIAKRHVKPSPRIAKMEKKPIQFDVEEGDNKLNAKGHVKPSPRIAKMEKEPIQFDVEEGDKEFNAKWHVKGFPFVGKMEKEPIQIDVEEGDKEFNAKRHIKAVPFIGKMEKEPIQIDVEEGDKESDVVNWHQFKGKAIDPQDMSIGFRWNAFERGIFKLNPRIDFEKRNHEKYILNSFMVLKLFEMNLCEYPVDTLELPEDYTRANELFNFLKTLSSYDGFVTDKMRGRYERSLTLLQIVEGVEEYARYKIVDGIKEYARYKIVDPLDKRFVVAGCVDLQ